MCKDMSTRSLDFVKPKVDQLGRRGEVYRLAHFFYFLLELSSKGLSGKCLGRWGGDTFRSDRVHLTKDL